MNPEERNEALKKIARLKHDRVHSMTTYVPLVTLAWRSDKVTFTPWPAGYWRQMQEVGLK
jgi:hypothetical protein